MCFREQIFRRFSLGLIFGYSKILIICCGFIVKISENIFMYVVKNIWHVVKNLCMVAKKEITTEFFEAESRPKIQFLLLRVERCFFPYHFSCRRIKLR